ncbi:MAG TPA: hypothetical protein PKA10_19920 [Selenomonadales bacterium]|nr:hypothetical protein [Selenomonadales bacterium]
MADSRAVQLENYDLTRKIYAIRALEIVSRAMEDEARKQEPDLAAIASLAAATASLLSSVS